MVFFLKKLVFFFRLGGGFFLEWSVVVFFSGRCFFCERSVVFFLKFWWRIISKIRNRDQEIGKPQMKKLKNPQMKNLKNP